MDTTSSSSSVSESSSSVMVPWICFTASFNCSSKVTPSFALTVTSCFPYWVLSVVNSPSTISGCSAKYALTEYPSAVSFRCIQSGSSMEALSLFWKNKISETTPVLAFLWNALFGRRIAPNNSARFARYCRTAGFCLSIVPLEVTTATTPPGRIRSRDFAIK